MKSQILKFRGMSHSLQFSQLGTSINIYFTGSSFQCNAKNTLGWRDFTSFVPRLLNDNRNIDFTDIKPIAMYANADTNRTSIINENRGKSGIYRWTNLINNKSYIGSSVNLTNRFYDYFNTKKLMEGPAKNMIISKAILKYGYSNFKLDILEYCEPENAIKREQYFIDSLKPEYNILQIAGSSLGFKHTEESLTKLRGRIFTEEHKNNMKKSRAS